MSKIYQSHPGFDIESEIVKAGNRPSPVDLSVWQRRIDDIAGKTLENRSRLRIIWGQAFDATIWCVGRRRMKYPFWRYEEAGEIHDIGTPRFYVEELHDISELKQNDGWESARYQWNGLEKIDVLGPIPEEGFYTSVFLIAHHDELCCNGSGQIKGNLCLGAYRPPTDSDLIRIRRMKQRRDNAANFQNRPTEEQITKWTAEAAQKRDEAFSQKLRESIDNWVAVHGHRITDSMNYKQLARGKWKFMPTKNFDGSTKETNVRTSSDSATATA